MIFNKAYKSENRGDFLNFLRVKLFSDNLVENTRPLGIDRQTIFFDKENCFELGKVNLDKDVAIFEIKQKSKNDPRITLTRDASKIMEDKGINNALIVFYSDDSPSWRLSLLTIKKSWGEKEISDPKRYSFLLGEEEKTRTPEKYLNKQISSFDDLLKCFDVEIVRKEFFNHYLTLYIRLYKAILADTEFVSLLKGQQVELVSFTKNLLGKIVFLYFIQKKGWLGVKRDGEYGKDGDKNFMRSIWNDFKNNEESLTLEKTNYFYNDYLEWLFFDGLNKDRRESEDYFPNLKMKVPYLNGGLFKEDYKKWDENTAKISNDIFSNDNKDGIIDIFDTYNFTIDEDDLYDSDIAIDPEMLGRIFEKMISISPDNIGEILEVFESKKKIEIDKELNKKFGAFYTPREIVHYMTKESLISYLINNLKGKKEDNERKVRKLFELKEQFLITKSEITEEIFDELADIIDNIDNLLQKVKILDPAIGSGAFPMGILHEVSTIRYYIYGAFYIKFKVDDKISDFLVDNPIFKTTGKGAEKKVSMYKIKRDIIQKSIYGVDISAGAIDIAKLRFWLSLVVDEEIPEPLPNFEFKFVCANTLVPLAEEQEQIQIEFKGDKELKLDTVKGHMSSYYNAETNSDKEKYRTLLEKYLRFGKNLTLDLYDTKSERTKQLETYDPFNPNHSAEFFDPSFMMGNAKFDIVISNPPYIKERDNAPTFEPVNNSDFGKRYHQGKMDFWFYFLHYAMDVIKNKGHINFITNSYWTKSAGSSKLIKRIGEELVIDKIIDFGDYPIFQGVSGKHMIHTYVKNDVSRNDRTLFIDNKDKLIIDNSEGIKLKSSDIIRGNKIYYSNDTIFGKENHKLLGDFFDVSQGVVEAPDKISKKISKENPIFEYGKGVFVLSKNELTDMELSEDEKLSFKKYLNNSEVGKYGINYEGDKLLYTDNEVIGNIINGKFNNLKNHLDYYSSIISSSNAPYGIHRVRKQKFFNNPKLICKCMFKTSEFTYDDEGYYMGMSFSSIIQNEEGLLDLKYLLSIINSKLGNYWFKINGKQRGVGVDIGVNVFREFPVIENPEEKQKPFIELVDQILEITKESFYDPKNPPKEQIDLEGQIDDMVYELYGLSEEEVRVVEKSLK